MPTDLTTVLLDLFVPGDPAPQGSKRLLGSSNGGRPRAVESSKKVAPWRADVRDSIVTALGPDRPGPHTGPVRVDLVFRLRRPAAHHVAADRAKPVRESAPAYPTSKPDADKLARAVLDAIGSTGMVYADDAQVVDLIVRKTYTGPMLPQPGVHVEVRRLG